MKTLYTLLLPVFLISAGACKKPVLEVTEGVIPPMVLATAIEDSLPSKTVDALKLRGATGVKVQYYSGVYSSYFEYEAEKNAVIEAISEVPFPMSSKISDTHCRRIPFEAFETIKQNISGVELGSAPDFWNTNGSHIEIFECVKAPFKHTLQFKDGSDQVRHRIELLEQT